MKKLILLLIVALIVGWSVLAEGDCIDELRGLGIDISDEAGAYVRSELDLYKDSGYDVDNEYMFALYVLGMGEWDMASDTFETLTNSVYAFDMEMTWIEEGYMDALDAVERLSGGAVDIQNVSIEIDDETAEAGWGTFPITFDMNGEACSYTARLDTDWMDPGFLDFLNGKLKGIGDGRQLWFATDSGQDVVMFYRDKDWIDRFSAATGIKFFKSMRAEMSVVPWALLWDWLS